jgi:hypothetical protein
MLASNTAAGQPQAMYMTLGPNWVAVTDHYGDAVLPLVQNLTLQTSDFDVHISMVAKPVRMKGMYSQRLFS